MYVFCVRKWNYICKILKQISCSPNWIETLNYKVHSQGLDSGRATNYSLSSCFVRTIGVTPMALDHNWYCPITNVTAPKYVKVTKADLLA